MITNRSTRQQLREEVDGLRARLAQANRARADEFERWAERCRTLKAQNEQLNDLVTWLREVKDPAGELVKLMDQLKTHETACGWTRAPLTEAEDRSSGG